MAPFHVAAWAREGLQRLAHRGRDARQVRRAQALIWLHEGRPASAIARQLGVNRRTLQRWVKRYQAQVGTPVVDRLKDHPRPGRPARHRQAIQRLIEKVWDRDPRQCGFRALLWTVPMLRCLFHKRTGHWVSTNTIRRALHQLQYRYKRPRLVLALRRSTWRQAKGGLNGDCSMVTD
jgi:transposase